MAADSPPRPPSLREGGEREEAGLVQLGRGPAREKKKPAWAQELARSITTVDDLAKVIRLTPEELEGARRAETEGLSLRITPHYLSLVDGDDPSCPIRKQVVPQAAEKVTSAGDLVDPLGEEAHTVAPHLVRRYPDRALLLATDRCAVYCRFCTRSRLVGDGGGAIPMSELEPAMQWLEANAEVRDVILSGGDPLAMATPRIVRILERLRRIESVETIRLATRVPVALLSRITSELLRALKPFHPLWVMTHFNHPKELAPAALRALERLANAGFPVMNQSVLLKGINDDPEVLAKLFRGLVRVRARPYYLLQMDPVRGTGHLRTKVSTGIEILEALQGKLSGIAIPKLVVDTPGGMGKVPLAPDYVIGRGAGKTTFRTPRGVVVEYVDPSP